MLIQENSNTSESEEEDFDLLRDATKWEIKQKEEELGITRNWDDDMADFDNLMK